MLALADTVRRPPTPAALQRERVDAVICLGDLQPAWIEWLAALELPKLGIYGNHDDSDYMPGLGIEDLHLRSRPLGDTRFSGFEGCVRYKREGPHQYTQEEATALMPRLPAADVLLCHCPPPGVNDDPDDRAHVGYAGLRTWVEEHRPRHLLHGHTYPRPGHLVHRLGPTTVTHVTGWRILEVEG